MFGIILRQFRHLQGQQRINRFICLAATVKLNGQSEIKQNDMKQTPIHEARNFLQSQMILIRCFSQTNNEDVTESIPISERIEKLVKENKVVIFMKGVPEQPMCGFSNAVVQVLRMHGVDGYKSHNVLEDDELRQGIKEYSDWPTIPQVYFNGEFVGGCDIMLQMHQNGELVDELEKLGIKSALVK